MAVGWWLNYCGWLAECHVLDDSNANWALLSVCCRAAELLHQHRLAKVKEGVLRREATCVTCRAQWPRCKNLRLHSLLLSGAPCTGALSMQDLIICIQLSCGGAAWPTSASWLLHSKTGPHNPNLGLHDPVARLAAPWSSCMAVDWPGRSLVQY